MLSPTTNRSGAAGSGRSALGPYGSAQLPPTGLLSGRALTGQLGVNRHRSTSNLLAPIQLTLPTLLPDFHQVQLEVKRHLLARPKALTPKEANYPIPFLTPAEQARRAREKQQLETRVQQKYRQLVHPFYFTSIAQALPKIKPKPKLKPVADPSNLPTGSAADCFMPTSFWKTQYQPTPTGWKPRLIRKKTKNGIVYELEKFNHWRDCCNTCKRLIYASQGYVPEHRVQLVKERHGELVAQPALASGIAQLDAYMANKVPVMIGVHYKFGTTYNADHTTEHFIVLVGSGVESGRKFYRFFDVGTRQASKGTDSRNRLYYDVGTGSFTGHSYTTSHDYTISQLRFNK